MSDRAKLIDYAKQFLRVTCRPDEAIVVTVEQVVEFAELLRSGCLQDLQRLIVEIAPDSCNSDGETALVELSRSIGESVSSWGLPDCSCDKADCVYCGPRIATRVLKG